MGPSGTAPAPRLATAADLTEDGREEVIHGRIVPKPRPSAEHSFAQFAFGGILGRRFDRAAAGRWPGGWWMGIALEVEYGPHEVFLHDLGGWRREALPQLPTGRPPRTRPDWACELLTPGNSRHDCVDKLQVLHASGVPHYWLADPVEHTLTVHRWEPNGYLIVLAAAAGETVRAEPFEAVELSLSVLFGVDDDVE